MVRWSMSRIHGSSFFVLQEEVWLFPDDASFEEVLDNTDRCLSRYFRIGCVVVAKVLDDLATSTFKGVCK